MSTRSANECWTCRLRRKKCDESHPACIACDTLGIECSGYGTRPSYMDGGPKEKIQREKIKCAIKVSSSRKRLPQRSKEDDLMRYHVYEFLRSASPAGSADSSSLSTPIKRHENITSIQSLSHPPSESKDSDFALSCTMNDSEITPMDSYGNFTDQEIDVSTSMMFMQSSESEQTLDKYASELEPWDWPTSACQSSEYDSGIDLVATTSIREAHSTKPSTNFVEAILLMHYLDHVLYIQFPFYNSSLAHHRREWVVSLLENAKPVYHAALALSSYQNDAENYNGDENTRYHTYRKLHTLALQGLHEYLNPTTNNPGTEHGIKVLFCIIQLIFCDVFEGSGENWQVHLQAASAYLIPLKSAKPCWRLEKSGPLAFASMENGNRPCGRNEGVDIDDVIKTITAILIALDILSSASTRSPSLLQVDHEQILRHGDIQLSDIMGCDTRVMVLIGQVSALDEWKRACEANCRLSVMELGKRADSIEMSLDEFLYATESTLEDAACSLTGEGPGVIPSHETSQFITKLISNVFALAAITYLHVVVSGNNPDLEEIQDSVSKTIAAIKRLPDISLLRRIVWPFCVTGCLASGEQVKDLQSMAERAGITCNTPGGLWKAVKAMEECERMREENMGNQDWVMAMSFLGSQVLLL